jgi:signal transduction histidine kinase
MAEVFADRSTLQRLAQRMKDESMSLAFRWQERLDFPLSESRPEVFPSHQLLEHIRALIVEIAAHIEEADASVGSKVPLIERAAALGELRHTQHASVHHLLDDCRALSDLLEEFVAAEIDEMGRPDVSAAVLTMRRLGRALKLLQFHAVTTFVANYTHMLERQTTQLRTFSRLVSHEIRQPLAVLQVIARALPVQTDGDAARMMDIFDRSVLRLADVTGKLERLARVSRATDLSLSERRVNLTEVAHAVAAQLHDAATAQGVDVRVHPRLPEVWLDPARAELIFLNLIANAIKFSDPEKPTRYVEIAPATGDDPGVIVRDNGLGMAAARLQMIFREFVRAHAQHEDAVRAWGLGLGLSIVRECMDHANGFVRVDSIEGRGTTFTLTWPPTAVR